jgi:cobaltochelatase CobN
MTNAYQRRRNIVVRPDGTKVNVARQRGQLFVCQTGCCCGRTEDGFAPVPTDLYHNEWERRRFRNIVHLTVGGCLGPCALANVVMLLFDGQSFWFHSMDGEERILALYDHIERMLDADRILPTPSILADLQFTAADWQPRPDGQPVDDRRLWGVRRESADSLPTDVIDAYLGPDACALPPKPGAADAPDAADRLIASMTGAEGMPRKNGEMVFDAPWQGRAFGMVAALHEQQLFDWEEFRIRLIDRIAVAENSQESFDYYTCWLGAFEDLLAFKGIVLDEELEERTSEYEFGEREEVF